MQSAGCAVFLHAGAAPVDELGVGHNARVDYAAQLMIYLARGQDLQAALELLRNDGASPVEALAAIQQATGADEQQARQALERSAAWTRPRVASGPPEARQETHEGQHGRSGHGASSVLPHLLRQPPAPGSERKDR